MERLITIQELESLKIQYLNDPVRKMFLDEINRVHSISNISIRVYPDRIEHVLDEKSQIYVDKLIAEIREYEKHHYSELFKNQSN